MHALTTQDLHTSMFSETPPILIDVSIDEDVAADPYLVPGAVRLPHDSLLTAELPEARYVLICQKGLKLSAGGAAILRARGFDACHMIGGNYAWRDAQLPRLALRDQPSADTLFAGVSDVPDQWLSAWVLKRFMQPSARTIWVAADIQEAVCAKFAAQPLPSFENLLASIHPVSPALQDMAALLRDPQYAAVMTGMVLRTQSTEELASAAAGFFDALYLGRTAETGVAA